MSGRRPIKSSRIRKFLDSRYPEEDPAYYALLSWEEYLSSRDNPHSSEEESDIYSFIEYLKNEKNHSSKRTIAQRLTYLSKYFEHYNETSLSDLAKEIRRAYDSEIREDSKNEDPISEDDIKKLYNYKKLRPHYKVIIRILVLEKKIPVRSLDRIYVKPVLEKGEEKYYFSLGSLDEKGKEKKEEIEINGDTVILAEKIIKKNISKGDYRLLTINPQSIDDQMKKYSRKAGCEKELTPKDLDSFSQTRPTHELVRLLQE